MTDHPFPAGVKTSADTAANGAVENLREPFDGVAKKIGHGKIIISIDEIHDVLASANVSRVPDKQLEETMDRTLKEDIKSLSRKSSPNTLALKGSPGTGTTAAMRWLKEKLLKADTEKGGQPSPEEAALLRDAEARATSRAQGESLAEAFHAGVTYDVSPIRLRLKPAPRFCIAGYTTGRLM